MDEKRRWKGPECKDGIRKQGSRQELCLKKERTTSNGIRGRSSTQRLRLGSRTTLNKTFRRTVELDVVKRIVGS
jgi:hypothetical protein